MHQVEWLTSAERELTQLWLGARDRIAITEATSRLDSILRVAPGSVGESRDRNERITFVEPLGAVFRVLADRRLVHVVHVWRTRG